MRRVRGTSVVALAATAVALACGRIGHAPTEAGPAGAPGADLARFDPANAPGRIVDPDHALWHFTDIVRRQADGWYEDLGIDFHVVVLKDGERPMEELTDALFHLRSVGRDAPTGGLLLVVDTEGHRAHLQPSYELEPAFPDAMLARVTTGQLAPYASYSILGMAVMDVLHVLQEIAWLRAADGQLALAAEYKASADYADAERYLAGGGGALARWSELPLDRDWKRRIPDPERSRYAPSADPLESVAALRRSIRDCAGDPSLELFTPGSRVQRAHYPFAAFEQLKQLDDLEDAGPLAAELREDRAVVRPESPAPGFLPILLQRIDGSWRVDGVETYKNLRFTSDGRWIEAYTRNPYHFGLADLGPGPGSPEDRSALDLGGRDPAAVLEQLRTREGALFRFLEGEVLFRNCFVVPEAIARYEQAVAEAPDAPAFARVLADRARDVGFRELAATAYARVGRSARLDRAELLVDLDRQAEAVELAEQALRDDPFDLRALTQLAHWIAKSDPGRAQALEQRSAAILADSGRYQPIEVGTDPPRPTLEIQTPERSGDARVHDHARFAVRFTNRSSTPIRLESLEVTARGTGERSSLGHLEHALDYASSPGPIAPGESAVLERLWGFDHDTDHQQLSYVFDYCWRAAGPRRCRSARVDLFPR